MSKVEKIHVTGKLLSFVVLCYLIFFRAFYDIELCMVNVTNLYDLNQLNCSCPDACRYVHNKLSRLTLAFNSCKKCLKSFICGSDLPFCQLSWYVDTSHDISKTFHYVKFFIRSNWFRFFFVSSWWVISRATTQNREMHELYRASRLHVRLPHY